MKHKLSINGMMVTLKRPQGAEPSCPRCGNYNAMLMTTILGRDWQILECRDCHLIVADKPRDNYTKIVTRALGKTCSNCGSFEMKDTGNRLYRCQECGKEARY